MRTYERISEIKKAFKNLDIATLVAIYNEYCYNIGSSELIFDMRDIDGMLGQVTASELLLNAYFGEFNPTDEYVYELSGNKKYLYSFNTATDKNFLRIFNANNIAREIAESYRNVEDMSVADILRDYILDV